MKYVGIMLALCSAVSTATAQSTFVGTGLTLDPTTLPAASAATSPTTEPAEGPNQFLTLYFENDGSFVRPWGTDKHYTSGEGFSFAAQPEWARSLGRYIPSAWDQFDPSRPDTTFAAGFIAAQDIYTPQDLTRVNPDPYDRPYAGWLRLGLFWQRAVAPAEGHATMEHFQLDLGMIGPSSLADKTQKFIHTHVTSWAEQPEGWQSQLHDEPEFNFTYLRKWRFTLNQPADNWVPVMQVIPEAGVTAGTLQRMLVGGVLARAGWNYTPDDFGPGNMHEVAAFTGRRQVESPFGFYVFGRAGGMLVEHNTLLEGNNFRDSPGVDATPLVGEFQAGVALQFLRHVELVWAQVVRTPEFHSQHGGDGYGTMALTVFWNF